MKRLVFGAAGLALLVPMRGFPGAIHVEAPGALCAVALVALELRRRDAPLGEAQPR